MPEPISSTPSARIFETYRTAASLTAEAPAVPRAGKLRARITDTVRISREAREKLRQANETKHDDRLYREQRQRERDEALKQSLEVLELGAATSRETIKRAYRHLISNYHPDRYAHLPPEFRKLAEMKARQIIEAYDKLNDE